MEEEREEREKRRTGENSWKNGNVYKAIAKSKREGKLYSTLYKEHRQ